MDLPIEPGRKRAGRDLPTEPGRKRTRRDLPIEPGRKGRQRPTYRAWEKGQAETYLQSQGERGQEETLPPTPHRQSSGHSRHPEADDPMAWSSRRHCRGTGWEHQHSFFLQQITIEHRLGERRARSGLVVLRVGVLWVGYCQWIYLFYIYLLLFFFFFSSFPPPPPPFFLPSTSLWGVYSETFIHRYNIPLTHALTRLCMICFPDMYILHYVSSPWLQCAQFPFFKLFTIIIKHFGAWAD